MENTQLHKISITGIIYRESDGKYLITKRSPHKKAFASMWTVPGGKLESSDYTDTKPTTEQGHWYGAVVNALKREIREEVNLEVDKMEYLLDIIFINKDVPTIILSYYCRYMSGEIKLDDDAVEYKWVTAEEAKEYDLIDGILGEIEMVDKKLNK